MCGCHSMHQLGGCGCDLIKGGGKFFSSAQSGGGCGCGLGGQNGGSNTALIGSPWTASIGGWPGVNGSANHYDLNTLKTGYLQTQIGSERTQQGGRSRAKKSKRLSYGGGLIPQDLVNMGRTITSGASNVYNSLSGYPQAVSPMPYNNSQLLDRTRTLGY